MRIRIALTAAVMAAPLAAPAVTHPPSAGTSPASSTTLARHDPKPPQPGFGETVLAQTATLLFAPAGIPPPPPTPAAPADTVTPAQRASWTRVALCEEGGDWQASGPRFSGGLGITRSNWIAYGGDAYATEAAMATEDQQIMVAERIEPDPPDQDGCQGW